MDLVKNLITPRIQKFAEKVHIAYNELLIPRGEHFEEYLFRTYKKYSIINTLVFKNEQRLLKISEDACEGLFPEDFGDEPVLFLDAGATPFYVDAPSYSRYFFNLPMQRWQPGLDWEIQKSEFF